MSSTSTYTSTYAMMPTRQQAPASLSSPVAAAPPSSPSAACRRTKRARLQLWNGILVISIFLVSVAQFMFLPPNSLCGLQIEKSTKGTWSAETIMCGSTRSRNSAKAQQQPLQQHSRMLQAQTPSFSSPDDGTRASSDVSPSTTTNIRAISNANDSDNARPRAPKVPQSGERQILAQQTALIRNVQTNDSLKAAPQQQLQQQQQQQQQQQHPVGTLVSKDDYIMQRDYDKSPIVVPQHKLIFFTTPKVGCTVWKKLFRRMMGYADWDDSMLAHDPKLNGLTYLADYSTEEAEQMLRSREWTKAIWVRDPKERFLSAYLDKAVSNNGKHIRNCCQQSDECIAKAQSSLDAFYDLVTNHCAWDAHWLPQSERIDAKYWPVLQDSVFVGHFDTNAHDAKRLLRHLQVWQTYGVSGWGPPASSAASFLGSSAGGIRHMTSAGQKLSWYYTPQMERKVDRYFAADYELELLGLKPRAVVYPNKQQQQKLVK